jgi:hypothetical protein
MVRGLRRLAFVAGASAVIGVAAPPARASDLALVPNAFVAPKAHLSIRAAGYWGGEYATAAGATVTVFASEAYTEKPEENQRWADFLARLVHGKELETLTLYRVSPRELRSLCGVAALACYAPRERSIVAPVEQPAPDVTVEAALIHEYGHHVARERLNRPWSAVDWGTKRWASNENVCARARRREVFPGAEDRDRYELNPGEGFAEVYRVLNERRLGLTETGWQVVSRTFYPDGDDLRLVEQDVTAPWLGPTATAYAGQLARRRVRTVSVSTPLDGTLALTLRAPAGFRADVLGPSGRLARATVRSGSASTSSTICGARTIRLRVGAGARGGAYSLRVTKP